MESKWLFLLLPILIVSCQPQIQSDGLLKISSSIELPVIAVKDRQLGEPYLYTDSIGKIYLSWIEKSHQHSHLKYSTWDDGKWSESLTIATGMDWFINWADFPQMAAFNDGTLLSFFLEKNGESTFAYGIQVILSKDGRSWSPPKTLHDDLTQTEHGFVSLLPWGDNMLISWLDGRNTNGGGHDSHGHGHGGSMTLRAALLNSEGEKLEEWELDDRVCDCCQTTSAMTENGPVILFRDRTEDEIRDMGMIRWTAGGWSETSPLAMDLWQTSSCPVNGPKADAFGNSLGIAWYTAANEKPQVKVIFSNDGGVSFGQPIRVDLGKTIGRVDLVMLDQSVALVSWMEGPRILSRKIYTTGKLGDVIEIASSSEKRSSGFPQLTKGKEHVVYAWTDDSGSESVIKTSLLNYGDY